MSDASLTVKMSLDRLALKQGLEGASNDAKGFKDTFERSMRDTKGAVKDVAGSIDGIGRAFDGSVQGAISGFKDFVGLLSISPWAAWGAGVAGIITGVAKVYESQINKIADSEDKLTEARARNRESYKKATGLDKDTADQALKSGKKEAQELQSVKLKEVEGLTDKINENNRKAGVLMQSSVMWADEIKKINEENLDLENKRGEASKQLAKLNEGIADIKEKEDADELKREQAKVEAHNRRVRKYFEEEKKAAQEKKKIEEEADKIANKKDYARQKTLELFAGANEKLQDIFTKQRTSIFDNADVYQKIGGQVGRNLSPQLREADIRQQREKEMIELAKDTADSLGDIKRTLSTALQQSEQL